MRVHHELNTNKVNDAVRAIRETTDKPKDNELAGRFLLRVGNTTTLSLSKGEARDLRNTLNDFLER